MFWNHQIRSYVLQPYTIAKDLRTGREETDVHAVLDGKLDGFLEEAVRRHILPGQVVDHIAEASSAAKCD